MLKSHEKFHSANGKRLILVADDELINRELLGLVLQNDYEVIYAEDGRETLEKMRQTREQLSLVLMDLKMPVMGGLEVLRRVRQEPELAVIPIIVLTSDQDAEIESLSLGAIDFIPKPYPQAGVMLARILRTIELSENRQIINSTERDPLTGLYNREYFYRYAEQFDHHHKETEMDAVVVDINHFHMINERFGTVYGDSVLRRIGEKMREMVQENGGIVCRREADTFMVYCPHGRDWQMVLESASAGLSGDVTANNRVRLRMGIYENVDKDLDIERRFDRAKMAADTVRGSFAKTIGIYDSMLHERELYSERLIEDFYTAIEENQFKVFYQPKFDVRPEIPVLASAEALVRWFHPTLGMISPGVFIPLFEENGLIQRLDQYVWAETAAQIRDWRERFGITVPVSVNVSRIDMYDPNLVETFQEILEKNGLTTRELLLEITESAYTQDSEQIIDTVNRLRSLGFRIEMDDFGTGYSSLNMISTLPIDALKLDMQFIRNAFNQRKDTRMLEVIIEIADYLSVPVIAEGVETEDQLNALRAMGCDLVQGYYFSRPVPPEEYEQFVAVRAAALEDELTASAGGAGAPEEKAAAGPFGVPKEKTAAGPADTLEEKAAAGSACAPQEKAAAGPFGVPKEKAAAGPADALQEKVVAELAHIPADPARGEGVDVLEDEQKIREMAAMDDALEDRETAASGSAAPDREAAVSGDTAADRKAAASGDAAADRKAAVSVDAASDKKAAARGDTAPLSTGYESIYYVDTQTHHYVEFGAKGRYEDLQIERSGPDFFADTARNAQRVVYEDDRERVLLFLEKETLLTQVAGRQPFVMTYRLVIGGKPLYYSLKAVRARTMDGHHIVIGVSNVDAQMRQAGFADGTQDREERVRNTLNFSSLASALSTDVESIYYVDTESDSYMEFRTEGRYRELQLEVSGKDFFHECQKNIPRVVFEEDRDKVSASLTKKTLLQILHQRRVFSMVYRLLFEGRPAYYRLKVVRADKPDDHHIIIGVSNIDAQITDEEKLEAHRQSHVTFARIAEALSQDYFSIYYVDTETDQFIEYSAHEEYKAFGFETMGDDFFNRSRENIRRVIYPEDLSRFLQVFTKERVMGELADNHTFTMTYRLLFNGEPAYVRMKATRMADPADPHIVIGVNNVNAEMVRRREMVTYASIAEALAADYFSIYYVDTETDRFIEYSSHEEYQQLGIETEGEDFFDLSRSNIPRAVHPDDVQMVLDVFQKEKILAQLHEDKTFTLTYRLMFEDVPTYVHMKATRMEDRNDPHIVIGVSNIDEQMRREQEHSMAVRAVNRDPLTGVKSKHAFTEMEKEVDAAITAGEAEPFAVTVCDLNGLKHINDTQGHMAGDKYLKDGCLSICHVFKHSPVYRIGGDEFVAILRGRDYEARTQLLRSLEEKNAAHHSQGRATIAAGLSEYRPGEDRSITAVFERADAVMYENKKRMKEAGIC